MSGGGVSYPRESDPHIAQSLALGLAFGVAATLFLGTGLIFSGFAAYLSLTPYLEPRWAALAVGGFGLVLGLIVALIGRVIVTKSTDRLVRWVKSSAIVALAPHILSFAARHAKLFGLASAAGAAFFATRSKASK